MTFNPKSAYGKIHTELKVEANESYKESITRLSKGMDVVLCDA